MRRDRFLHPLPRLWLGTLDVHLYHINSALVLEQRIQRDSLNNESLLFVLPQFSNEPIAESPRETHQLLSITNREWINCNLIESVSMKAHVDQLAISRITFDGYDLARLSDFPRAGEGEEADGSADVAE